MRDLVLAVGFDILFRQCRARPLNDPGIDFLTIFLMWNVKDLNFLNILVGKKKFLDLARTNILAAVGPERAPLSDRHIGSRLIDDPDLDMRLNQKAPIDDNAQHQQRN